MIFASINLAASLLPVNFQNNISNLDTVSSQQYWGSINSDKFHYPSCHWAKKIYKENLIVFKSRKEALDAGYIPCKVCKP